MLMLASGSLCWCNLTDLLAFVDAWLQLGVCACAREWGLSYCLSPKATDYPRLNRTDCKLWADKQQLLQGTPQGSISGSQQIGYHARVA